jgi:hypothetical protein
MLKATIIAASVVLATSAFAQNNMQKGQSEFAPGQQTNKPGSAPGHSESAPGQQANKPGSAPGHSESTPGHQTTTTGSAPKAKK